MKLCVAVFSKDRPLQLHATLASMFARSDNPRDLDVSVLYTTSDSDMAARYVALQNEFDSVDFVKQTVFNQDLQDIVRDSEYVMFVCDDALFVRPWSAWECIGLLSDFGNAIGLSLRLGKNTTHCYPLNREQKVPENIATCPGLWLQCNWTESDGDFGYPLELSSSIYRTRDVWPLLSGMMYDSPNTLESVFAASLPHLKTYKPFLIYPPKSIAFCAPLNVVQSTHPNRHGCDEKNGISVLAMKFDQGYRVDERALGGYTPKSCHEEIELPLHRVAVSVVIPCYNQAQYLRQAIDSVMAQSMKAFELIVVDDGSTDGSAAIALSYKDPRVRIMTTDRSGVCAARNTGIFASRGRYILPLDADDMLDPTFLGRAAGMLDSDSTIAVVRTDVQVFGTREFVWVCDRPFDVAHLIQANGLAYASMYRRSVWQKTGGYDGVTMAAGYEDWDFWVTVAEAGFRCGYIPEPLFRYREKATSRNTGAMKHHASLHAQIMLNHPRSLYPFQSAAIGAVLKRSPLPTVRGA